MTDLTFRAQCAVANMVRMRSALKQVDQLEGSMQWDEYGIAIPERQHLTSILERYIKRCEDIIREEDERI